MGRMIQAVIGRTAPVSEFASRWVLARLIPLHQDFAMVPVTDALHDDIVELANISKPDPFDGFMLLAAGVEAALREASAVGALAYIETEYFGGISSQCAIAWDRGRVLVGPVTTKTTWDHLGVSHHPPGEWAINLVLAELGVRAVGKMDRFDSLGLGNYRETNVAAGDVR
jgi:hypothetical protein